MGTNAIFGLGWLLGWRASRSSGVSQAKFIENVGAQPNGPPALGKPPNYGGQPSPDGNKRDLWPCWLLGRRASRSSGVSRAKFIENVGAQPNGPPAFGLTPNYRGQPRPMGTNAIFGLAGFWGRRASRSSGVSRAKFIENVGAQPNGPPAFGLRTIMADSLRPMGTNAIFGLAGCGARLRRSSGVSRAKFIENVGAQPNGPPAFGLTPNYGGQPSPDGNKRDLWPC